MEDGRRKRAPVPYRKDSLNAGVILPQNTAWGVQACLHSCLLTVGPQDIILSNVPVSGRQKTYIEQQQSRKIRRFIPREMPIAHRQVPGELQYSAILFITWLLGKKKPTKTPKASVI